MISLLITPELRLTLELLAIIEPDYVSMLILALLAEFNDEDHIDSDDMPSPVSSAYRFWIGRKDEIIEI